MAGGSCSELAVRVTDIAEASKAGVRFLPCAEALNNREQRTEDARAKLHSGRPLAKTAVRSSAAAAGPAAKGVKRDKSRCAA